MSVGPLGGLTGNVAGAQQDANSQERKVKNEIKAESAAGIGATEAEDQTPHDRDADGRRLWEAPPAGKQKHEDQEQGPPRQSKDPTGSTGSSLDLTG